MAATAEGNALTREQQDRMCRNKRKFDKEGPALDFAVYCQRKGAFGPAGGRVYRCPVCTKYHVAPRAPRTTSPAGNGTTMGPQPTRRGSA